VKNIFRVRNPQTVQVIETDGAGLPVPVDAEASDAAAAELLELVPEQRLASSPPDPTPVDLEAADVAPVEVADVAVTEVPPPAPVRTPAPPKPEPVTPASNGRVWVTQYVIPEMEAIVAEIQELKQFILELEQRKAELEKKVNEREVLRNALLTGSGPALKQAVQYVFSEFGVSVQPDLPDQSDTVLEHKGLDFVVEVTACDGPLGLANIRQLNHWVEDFIGTRGRQPKGMLIANPFVGLPLDQREANGHVAFPEELRLLAEERYKFCLLTTPQLFVAYCKFKEGQLNVNELMTELFETVWVYGNHRDYNRFKVALETA
jgi:hypothetical protein